MNRDVNMTWHWPVSLMDKEMHRYEVAKENIFLKKGVKCHNDLVTLKKGLLWL